MELLFASVSLRDLTQHGRAMKMKVFYFFGLIVLTLGCWLTATVFWGIVNPGELIELTIIIWLFASTRPEAEFAISFKSSEEGVF